MNWISTTDDGNWYIGPARLPRRLGEALFPPRLMDPESRVLLLGTAANLEPWLDWLGISCQSERHADPHSLNEIQDHTFDVVLARDLSAYHSSLQDLSSLSTTAHLISKVRPGGRLVILSRSDPSGVGFATGHLRSCFLRHLQHFDCDCQVKLFGDPWSNWKSWNWLMGLQPRSGYLAAILQIPVEDYPADFWFSKCKSTTSQERQPCCLWSRQQLTSVEAHSIQHAA